MTHITIIPSDKMVIIDGEARQYDFAIDPNIHAIQWYGDYGIVERIKGGSVKITDFKEYQAIVDAFEDNAPPEPQIPDEPAYVVARREAYLAKEAVGDLPATPDDNIDELWKALETAELNGTELPPSASSIIRHRRAVKNAYPKPN